MAPIATLDDAISRLRFILANIASQNDAISRGPTKLPRPRPIAVDHAATVRRASGPPTKKGLTRKQHPLPGVSPFRVSVSEPVSDGHWWVRIDVPRRLLTGNGLVADLDSTGGFVDAVCIEV